MGLKCNLCKSPLRAISCHESCCQKILENGRAFELKKIPINQIINLIKMIKKSFTNLFKK